MATRGKLIALEGIDGSGKRTQLELLARALETRGLSTFQISFPRYESFYGKLVGRYLNGEFGALEAVNPHFSALLYAGDRLEAKPEMEAALGTGKFVLADRYIGSNMAHQSARMKPSDREEFLDWLKRLEYGVYALPAEDLVIYLRVPVAEAHRLVGLKTARAYTTLRRDIQEADMTHLQETAKMYERLATGMNWASIDCINPASGGLFPPEEIHAAVLRAVEMRIIGQVSTGRA
jgi:dTMP kinase